MNKREFDKYFKQYIDSLKIAKKSIKTISSYKIVLSKFSTFLSSATFQKTRKIEPITIANYRTQLFMTGLCVNSVRYNLIVLHTFFEWAIQANLLDDNPVVRREIPRQQQIEYNLLSLCEIKQILTKTPPKINKKTAIRNRTIVVMLVQSGLRNSELRMLTVADLDFENGFITVRHGKGDKNRVAPFPKLSRELARKYLNSNIRPASLSDNDFLFGTSAKTSGQRLPVKTWKPITAQALLELVNRYTRLCCGHKVGVHALRHAAASLWDDLGITIRDIQNALGHSSISTTEKIYVKVLNKVKTASKINTALDEMV